MRLLADSNEIAQLEDQLRLFQRMFSGTVLMLADSKGKVRITVPTLNEVENIHELHYDQNAAGAYVITVTTKAPEPKPKAKPKPKPRAAKK